MKPSLVALGVLMLVPIAAAQEARVSVDELADDVYLYTYNTHRSLFVATDEGVLATDPQSVEAARRYVQEIRKITSAPIRYLVYSHHHGDHVSGGAEFDENVSVVAQVDVLPHVPGSDGAIRPPDITFTDSASVYLGDLEVKLIYPGPSETASNIIVHVPARGVAFIVDAVANRTVPWRDLAGSNPDEWIAALRALAALDFDTLAPGHGPVGTKAHVQEYIEYMTTLRDAVQERIAKGQSLEEIQGSLELPQYAEWVRYDEHFELNIAGMHRELTKP